MSAALLPPVERLLADPAPVVRGAAVWAYRRLATPVMVEAMREAHMSSESDPEVCEEWTS